MRRSSRLEAASGTRAVRVSKLIAQHAQRVRQGEEESDEEWKEQASEASEEVASSEEDVDKRRAQDLAKKRKVVDSEDSDEANQAIKVKSLRAKMKMKKIKRSNPAPSPPVPVDRSAKRTTQAIMKGAAAAIPKRSEKVPLNDASDTHRRPVKQQKRTNVLVSTGSRTQQTTVSHSGKPFNNTLDDFFDEILEWKFYETLKQEAQRNYPNNRANDGTEEGEIEVKIEKVPSTFRSYEHYFSVWKPLALKEVQAQTINAVVTDQPNPMSISVKGFGATFIAKSCKIRVEWKKRNIPGIRHKNYLSDLFINDLVLISPDHEYFRKAFGTTNGNHSIKNKKTDKIADDTPPVGFLAIVVTQKASKEGLTMVILRSGFAALEREENIYLFKLNNLITSIREFRALCDCNQYRLLPLLLSGEHKEGTMELDSLGLNYVQWLSKTFNDSQREAIKAAATSEGFTLIKGPPGTGKTTTLKGLLNSLHLREYNRYYNAVLDVARRPDNETDKAWAQVGNEKPHILVTAPSNAAVDNIVSKVIEEGFCDGEGRRYFPKIVRVGRGLSATVQTVGLENQVDQICSQPLDVLEGHIRRLRQELMVVERDSLTLRNQLRNIVAWIEKDPVKALNEIAHAQSLQRETIEAARAARQSASMPVQLDLNSRKLAAASPSPASVSVGNLDSLPPPSSSGEFPSPGGSTKAYGHRAQTLESDKVAADVQEEEEDEDFPSSFGSIPPAWNQQNDIFNAEASGKALNAFLDDGSNSEEDEPLPAKAKIDDTEEQDEPFPDISQFRDKAHSEVKETNQVCNTTGAGSAEETNQVCNNTGAGSADEPILVDDNDDADATIEQDQPLMHQELNPNSSEDRSLVPPQPENNQDHDTHDSLSSPPPPPPLSPPPPPPLSPPPVNLPDGQPLPSSPTIMMPQSPRLPPPTQLNAKQQWKVIDYSRYHPYVTMAQRINGCLEKLSEIKLELQRYEFARQAVSEMRGKLSQSTRQSLEVSFLDTAHIVFTTLNSAGVAALDASARYDVLVVDEAAQAVELSTIIPMKFGSKQCVLVGDPQQLSATVFSRNSGQSLYERSLFERLESCMHPVHMLQTQYRSHPMISDFPRNYFYDGKLQDGDNVKRDDYTKPYHKLGPAFMPLVFWNLLSSREKNTKSVSRMNIGEAELAVNLYLTLKNSCPPDSISGKVGMITPYSQQMEELKNRFHRALGERYEQEVEINTVDGFQGREKDIIILSTVRADPKAGVGFLNDIRRMNVALTRAKFACYVIGKENTLRSSKPWSALLDHVYNRHCIVHVESPQCNLLTLKPMQHPSTTSLHRQSCAPQQYDRSGEAPSHGSNGWKSRGRGNGGGRRGFQRGGRGRGRGRGPPMHEYTQQQRFIHGLGLQYFNGVPGGGYKQPLALQHGGNVPAIAAAPQPGPVYFSSHNPAQGYISPLQGVPPPGSSSRPESGVSERRNVNPRDPRQRMGRGTGL